MSNRHLHPLPLVPMWPHGSGVYLLPNCGMRLVRRLTRGEMPSARGLPRLLLIGNGEPDVDELRLAIGIRLYGLAGALLLLDPMLQRHARREALPKVSALLHHCVGEGASLVIATRRSEASARAVLEPAMWPARRAGRRQPLAQPFLGRRRRTTSTPTISMPSGGTG